VVEEIDGAKPRNFEETKEGVKGQQCSVP